MRSRRVVIIGAGPAGSAAALHLARQPRIEVVQIERRSIPRTKVCGSGLSPWTLELLDDMGVGPLIRKEAHRIDGAIIGGLDGEGLELRGHHETAVLLRARFDELLAKEGARLGADLRDDTRVTLIERHARGVSGVRTSGGDIECDAVIDASGAKGRLALDERPEVYLQTMMGWYEGLQDTSDVVELYFDASVKPHYGWVFPETPDRVNIGIVFLPTEGGPNARDRFEAFLDSRLRARLRGATQLGKLVGHPVHASTWPRRDLRQPGVLVAGEAGHMVDIATAEGIFHALVSGRAAARTLSECFAAGQQPTPAHTRRYALRVARQLGPRMAVGRALMHGLRTPALDAVLRLRDYRATRFVLRRAFTQLYHG